MPEGERRNLSALFASWAHLIGHINETRGARLEALPKFPSPEELKRENQWISELVSTCDEILWALSEEGVIEMLNPIASAIEVGEPVPDDIRQPAIDFNNAWVVMFTWLRPKAVNWATRFWEKVQVDSDVDKKVAEWTKEHKPEEPGKLSPETADSLNHLAEKYAEPFKKLTRR